MPDYSRYSGLVEIGRHEHGGVRVGVVIPLEQLQGPATASSAACFIGTPTGSLNDPASPIRMGPGEKPQAERSSEAASKNPGAERSLRQR
jgi:hypothetical protein